MKKINRKRVGRRSSELKEKLEKVIKKEKKEKKW